jgi:uracil-DNA glycosylase
LLKPKLVVALGNNARKSLEDAFKEDYNLKTHWLENLQEPTRYKVSDPAFWWTFHPSPLSYTAGGKKAAIKRGFEQIGDYLKKTTENLV